MALVLKVVRSEIAMEAPEAITHHSKWVKFRQTRQNHPNLSNGLFSRGSTVQNHCEHKPKPPLLNFQVGSDIYFDSKCTRKSSKRSRSLWKVLIEGAL